jgi:hypothetical protein
MKVGMLLPPAWQTFPRQRVLTLIPGILSKLLIYNYNWWDGQPSGYAQDRGL